MWVNRSKWSNQLLRLLGWMLMFNMILSACSVVGVRAWEEPAYQTKLQDGKFEIREYQPYLVAEVYMEGEDFEQASGDGFRILADYIFGNNLSRSSAVQMAGKAEKESESNIKFYQGEIRKMRERGEVWKDLDKVRVLLKRRGEHKEMQREASEAIKG